MVLELAVLDVRPHQGARFESAFAEAQALIASMPGYQRHELRRCVEVPDRYLLLVWWDDLESHTTGFRQSPEYQRWKHLLHAFYDPFPEVQHYTPLLPGGAGVAAGGLDHASLPVSDLARASRFYDAVLATLGLSRRKELPDAVGYGPADRRAPVFWILARRGGAPAAPGAGLHLSFEAKDRPSVDAFHAEALRRGARDAGAPGLRPEYTAPFYGAFVLDPDGFKIEAVCRADT